MRTPSAYLTNAATTGLLNIVGSAVVTIVALPVIVARLGMDGYGLWAMLGIFVSSAVMLDVGAGRAVVYLFSKRAAPANELLTAASVVAMGACVAAYFVALLIAEMSNGRLWVLSGVPGDVEWVLVIAGTVILASTLLTSVVRSLLEAYLHSHLVNIGYFVVTALNFGVAMALACAGQSIQIVLLGSAAAYLFILALHLGALYGICGVWFGRFSSPLAQLVLRKGSSMYVVGLPTAALIPLLFFLLTRSVSDTRQYGQFDLAYRVATMSGSALAFVAVPVYALVARMPEQREREVRRLVGQYLAVTVVALILGVLLFTLIGKNILVYLSRSADVASLWWASVALLVGVGSLSAIEPILRAYLGRGHFAKVFLVRFVVAAVTLVALYFLREWPTVKRFALAYAGGCLFGAITGSALFGLRGGKQNPLLRHLFNWIR